jgi:hypothetical protein
MEDIIADKNDVTKVTDSELNVAAAGTFLEKLSYVAIWYFTYSYYRAASVLKLGKQYLTTQQLQIMLERRIRRDIFINIAVICYILVMDVMLSVSNREAKNYGDSNRITWNYVSWAFELSLGIVPLVSLILLISALRTI